MRWKGHFSAAALVRGARGDRVGFDEIHHLGAAGTELSSTDLARIGEALSRIKVQGDRYPARLAALVGR